MYWKERWLRTTVAMGRVHSSGFPKVLRWNTAHRQKRMWWCSSLPINRLRFTTAKLDLLHNGDFLRIRFWLIASAVLLPLRLPAQIAPAVPIKRVVLYKNGVGYFEHLGSVRGNQPVTISFTSGQLNDVLKSLTVSYISETPVW